MPHQPRLFPALLVVIGAALTTGTCASPAFAPRAAVEATRSNGSHYGDYLVASYAGNTRDSRVAAARYKAALAADPGNQNLRERAFIFSVAAGDMDQAGRFAADVAAANPHSDLAPLVLGVMALKANRLADANRLFTGMHAPGDPDILARMMLAWTAMGRGDAAGARALLAPGADDGSDIFLAYHRARLEEALGNVQAADLAYENADAGTAGKSLTIALAYAAWLQTTNRGDRAAQVLLKFLDSSPGNPVAVSAVARLRTGQPIARRVTTAGQGAAEAFYGIASALGDGETGDAAIVYLRLAQYLDPANDGALALLGGTMERAGRKDDAIELYLGVPKSSPFYMTAQVSAADLLDDRGDTAGAIRILERLERDEATGGLAASALGDVYRTREQWTDAIDAYGRAIGRAGPPFAEDAWPLFYARGISLERAGRWKAAEADFRQALELKPDQPQVLNYLAYSWLERGENTDQALAMLHRAVEQRPDDGYIIDSLGWAYYRLGQFDKAVDILEQALAFSPYEPTLNEHLGDAYWKVGRRREAQFLWSHALKLKPEQARIPILQAKLRGGLDAGEALERRQASSDTEPPAQP